MFTFMLKFKIQSKLENQYDGRLFTIFLKIFYFMNRFISKGIECIKIIENIYLIFQFLNILLINYS
jgi:hypothetical protein